MCNCQECKWLRVDECQMAYCIIEESSGTPEEVDGVCECFGEREEEPEEWKYRFRREP